MLSQNEENFQADLLFKYSVSSLFLQLMEFHNLRRHRQNSCLSFQMYELGKGKFQ